jgi:hypothetical protein
MSQDAAVPGNPYVGPRPFNEDETLYGRTQDTEALVDLLTAERIVLLYSPSGAGKTSLIQAALIPELRKRQFHVLPSIVLKANAHSPNGPPASQQADAVGATAGGSASRPTNRYVDTILLSLPDRYRQPPSDRVHGYTGDPAREWELKDWLDPGTDSAADRRAEVLIFDQFEEILTDPLVDEATRRDFFRQVGVALRDPWRWALFAMREDYLAGLDPYRRWIPNGFRTTYRLELLRPDAAMAAIQKPARSARPPVDFENDAAQALVDDLRRIRGEDSDAAPRLGEFVEPVQLQVVCYRLWENRAEAGRITADDVHKIDVDSALRDYYADKVRGAAAAAGLSERTVRIWIDDKLITRDGLRDQVRYTSGSSEGLDNRALQALEASHLVRSDRRGDRRWWELAHDRLIEPVRQDNRNWLKQHLQDWQMMTRVWNDNRSNSLLLRGRQLSEAERFQKQHPDEVSPEDVQFLVESRREADNASSLRNNRLVRFFLGTCCVGALLVILVLMYANNETQATLQAERFVSDALDPSTHPNLPPVLALASMNMGPRPSAVNALARSVASRSHFQAFLRDRSGEAHPEVHAVAYSPDGNWLASEGPGATVMLRDAQTHDIRQSLRAATAPLWSLAFSPDSRWLAAGGDDGTITIWEVPAAQPIATCKPHASAVSSLVFKPDDGTMLVSSGSGDRPETRLVVSRVPDCSLIRSLEADSPRHIAAVWSLAFDGVTHTSSPN